MVLTAIQSRDRQRHVSGFNGKPLRRRREVPLKGNPTGPKLQGLSNLSPPFFLFVLFSRRKNYLSKKKQRGIRYWALKIFIITLFLTAGISVITESLMGNMSVIAAAFIILFIVLIGIVFDAIGIAFAVCDPTPFISMASKKIKRAKSAIKLLKNADIVSNICGDVVGDICGIVSGATGVAIALKITLMNPGYKETVGMIIISSIIAALTVSGKAAGKTIAIRKNKEIVSFISYFVMFFIKDKKGIKNGR